MAKERLYYIDFMKGVCILLIVAVHLDEDVFGAQWNNVLQAFRVPLYYFLSGLFFRPYGSLYEFGMRKANNILVPLAFFYLLTCLLAGLASFVSGTPDAGAFRWQYIFDPLTTRYFRYSQPLWFLLSLFEVNMVYYLLRRYLTQKWIWVSALAVSLCGWLLASRGITLPLLLDTAMVALPFFLLGTETGSRGMLEPHPADRWGALAFPPVLMLLLRFARPLNILDQQLPGYLELYGLCFLAILSFFFFAKSLPRIPLICYLGEFSLILLCTQGYLAVPLGKAIRSVTADGHWQTWVTLAGFMAVELAVIPLCLRFIPRFVARQPLFPVHPAGGHTGKGRHGSRNQ